MTFVTLSPFVNSHHGGVGRRCGVGRGLGVTLGVAVGVGLAVGVAVGLGLEVGVGVTVAVGVGVGVAEGPDCAQYLPPVLVTKLEPSSDPPQAIISLPVHTAVGYSRRQARYAIDESPRQSRWYPNGAPIKM